MKSKLFLALLVGMFIQPVVAKNNFFCEDLPADECRQISDIVYQEYVDGYVQGVSDYQQATGQAIDKETAIKEAKSILTSDDFYTVFLKCGETSTEAESAKACLMREMEKASHKN